MNWTQITDISWSVVNNILVLISIAFLYANAKVEEEGRSFFLKLITGLIIGVISIILMSTPFHFSEGLIFDTRSVLLSITALYFTPTAGIVAAVIAAGFRLFLGGEGAFIGSSIAILSLLIGFVWRYTSENRNFKNKYIEYYVFGLIVNAILMSLPLLIPGRFFDLLIVTIISIAILPFLTILMGVILDSQKKKFMGNKLSEIAKDFLQSSMDSTKTLSFYTIDSHYRYLNFNIFHRENMLNYYNAKIKIGHNHLEYLKMKK